MATSHHLASVEALAVLREGGSTVDAAVAAGAVLSVTMPHAGGLGGDLMAVAAQDGAVVALDSSGRAGSGRGPHQLRGLGLTSIPATGDMHSVTVPGCVDGWLALHERYGRLGLRRLLQPAAASADEGVATGPGLASSYGAAWEMGGAPPSATTRLPRLGDVLRWPGLARTLRAVASQGRTGFYGGEFGERLMAMGAGVFEEADLQRPQAEWVEPSSAHAWGHELWSLPPNSPAHVMMAAVAVAERVGVPHPLASGWAHTLIEAVRLAAAGSDRVTAGTPAGEWAATHDRVTALSGRLSPEGVSAAAPAGHRMGGTVAVVVGDRGGDFVALLQSNGIGFGSGLAVPGLGIWLHNRGSAFSLEVGHATEYGPGRRPPHTLAPALVTREGTPVAAVGATGGHAQIQAVLQVLVRLLAHGQPMAAAVAAPRWVVDLGAAATTIDSLVYVEGHAPPTWSRGLDRRGHRVTTVSPYHPAFGRAQIVLAQERSVEGVSDPRASEGLVATW